MEALELSIDSRLIAAVLISQSSCVLPSKFLGVNLAQQRPVLASSQQLPDGHVSRMTDGLLNTQWASAVGDAQPWAWVDLLGLYTATRSTAGTAQGGEKSTQVKVSFCWQNLCLLLGSSAGQEGES